MSDAYEDDDEDVGPAAGLSALVPLAPLTREQQVIPSYIQRQLDFGSKLTGPAEEMVGKMDQSTVARKAAIAEKIAAIKRGTERLSQLSPTGPGRINAPMLAAATGLLSPTRTGAIGESFANAGKQLIPALSQQRGEENAIENRRMQLEEGMAGAQEQSATLDYNDLLQRLNLGQKFTAAATTAEVRRQQQLMRANASPTNRIAFKVVPGVMPLRVTMPIEQRVRP